MAARFWARLSQRIPRLGNRGNTTVEFGIVGPTFLLLVLAIFELGYMVFVQSVLDAAARDAARMVRTGQVQTSGDPTTTFQTKLCGGLSSLISCGSLVYQVQNYANWSAAQTALNQPVQRDQQGNMTGGGFSPGSSQAIVTVQVTYNYKFFTLWIASKLGGNTQSAFLMSTVVFQSEPYS